VLYEKLVKIKSYFIAPFLLLSKIIFGLLFFLTDRFHFQFLKKNKLLLGAFIISLAASVSGCNRHHASHGGARCYIRSIDNSEILKKISSETNKPDKV